MQFNSVKRNESENRNTTAAESRAQGSKDICEEKLGITEFPLARHKWSRAVFSGREKAAKLTPYFVPKTLKQAFRGLIGVGNCRSPSRGEAPEAFVREQLERLSLESIQNAIYRKEYGHP